MSYQSIAQASEAEIREQALADHKYFITNTLATKTEDLAVVSLRDSTLSDIPTKLFDIPFDGPYIDDTYGVIDAKLSYNKPVAITSNHRGELHAAGGVALGIKFNNVPAVLIKVNQNYFDHGAYSGVIVVCKKNDIKAVMEFLTYQDNGGGKKYIYNQSGEDFNINIKEDPWSNIVLHPETLAAVKTDFERFLNAKKWYHDRGFSWKRGYLLYGLPGNGKSSTVRAMLLDKRVNGFSIDLGDREMDNGSLTAVFTRARSKTPAVVILEDIDRLFVGKDGEKEKSSGITLQHLLNVIDGVQENDGVVIVATANEPKHLDPALTRPGRFDKLVEFRMPQVAQRLVYFQQFNSPLLTANDVTALVELTDGMSFGQLHEIVVLAGMKAFERGDNDASAEDHFAAVDEIKNADKSLKRYKNVTGSKRADNLGFERLM